MEIKYTEQYTTIIDKNEVILISKAIKHYLLCVGGNVDDRIVLEQCQTTLEKIK